MLRFHITGQVVAITFRLRRELEANVDGDELPPELEANVDGDALPHHLQRYRSIGTLRRMMSVRSSRLSTTRPHLYESDGTF